MFCKYPGTANNIESICNLNAKTAEKMLYDLTTTHLHVHRMTHSRPLTLAVARESDFVVAASVLCGLAFVAAILSPRPLLMSVVLVLICATGWAAYILGFSKFRSEDSTVIIFPDGQIRLESDDKDATGGLLDGQQWSTRFFAVLHVKTADGNRYLPVLSSRQQADDFRRLLMWLRQDFYRGARDNPAPGI